MDETAAVRRTRIEKAQQIAEQLLLEADRDKAAAAVKHFDEEGGMHPPSYCLGVATLAAHAMARSDDPKLLRAALFIMIDRQFADAEFIRQSEEAAGEVEASLANQETAGNA
jgi:hypothetical protein